MQEPNGCVCSVRAGLLLAALLPWPSCRSRVENQAVFSPSSQIERGKLQIWHGRTHQDGVKLQKKHAVLRVPDTLRYIGNRLMPERTKKCIANEMTLVLSLRCPLNMRIFMPRAKRVGLAVLVPALIWANVVYTGLHLRRCSCGLHPGCVRISSVPASPGKVAGQKVHRVLYDGEPPGPCPLPRGRT